MTAAPAPVPAPAARAGRLAGRPAHWFPLALFGVLAALAALLYAVPLPRGWATYGTGIASRSFSWSSSSGSSGYGSSFVMVSSGGAGVAAEGWYWAVAPVIGFLLTALWYRRAGGLFGLLAVAAGLGVLAGQVRSRALAIAVAAFTVAALAVNWPAIRGAWPALTYRGGDPWHAVVASTAQPLLGAAAPLLPALALLAAAAVLLIRRPAVPAEPSHDR